MTDKITDFLAGGGGASATRWVSGETVEQDAWKISPTDNEIYQRFTAAGGGAVDPNIDRTNYNARSWNRPVSAQLSSWANPGSLGSSPFMGAVITNPTPLVGVRTRILNAVGRGNLAFLAFVHNQANTRDRRFELIIDGVTILDTGTVSVPASSYTVISGAAGVSFNGTNASPLTAIPCGDLQYRVAAELWMTKSTDGDTGSQAILAVIDRKVS